MQSKKGSALPPLPQKTYLQVPLEREQQCPKLHGNRPGPDLPSAEMKPLLTPLGSMGYASRTSWGDNRNVSVGRNRDYCKGTHQITGDSWDWSCSKSQAICLYIHKSKRFSKSNYSIYLNPFADITSKACGSCNHTNTSKHDFTWQLQAVRLQLTPQAAMTIWETLNHNIHRN